MRVKLLKYATRVASYEAMWRGGYQLQIDADPRRLITQKKRRDIVEENQKAGVILSLQREKIESWHHFNGLKYNFANLRFFDFGTDDFREENMIVILEWFWIERLKVFEIVYIYFIFRFILSFFSPKFFFPFFFLLLLRSRFFLTKWYQNVIVMLFGSLLILWCRYTSIFLQPLFSQITFFFF